MTARVRKPEMSANESLTLNYAEEIMQEIKGMEKELGL